MTTFLEVFEKYIDKDKLNPAVLSAEVRNINVDSAAKAMTVTLLFPSLVSFADLNAVSQLLRASKLALRDAVIKPAFTPGLFEPAYVFEIIEELRAKIPRINGTFKNSEVSLNDNILTLTLQNGGRALLESVKFGAAVSRIIYERFDLNLKIDYTGVCEVSADSEQYIEMQHSTEERLHRESARKYAEMLEDEKDNAQKSAAKRAENAASEIEIRKDKFLKPQIIKSSVRPLYGRMIRSKLIPIEEVAYDSGKVAVWGEVIATTCKQTKSGDKNIITIDISDYTNSITVKVFGPVSQTSICEQIKACVDAGVQGDVEFDKFVGGVVINARSISTADTVKVVDKAPVKRVELHLHTNMSQMDGMTSASDLINRAASWGHTAIAVTDHGVAQAFPDAMNTQKKLKKAGKNIKIIYGTEAYFIDDLVESVVNTKDEALDGTFVCFDIETRGLSAKRDKITEIGAVKITNGVVTDTFSTFVDPQMPLPPKITELTGITDAMVKGAPSQSEAVKAFLEFVDGNIVVAHNAPFDTGFIRVACEKMGVEYSLTSIDTVVICRSVLTDLPKVKLDYVAKYLRLGSFNHHRATDDAEMLSRIFIELCRRLKEDYNINRVSEINTKIKGGDFKKLPTYHQIILVKNLTGLKNLYKLISASHLDYFYKKPRIPKSLLMKHREGLLIGSACAAALRRNETQRVRSNKCFMDLLKGKGGNFLRFLAVLAVPYGSLRPHKGPSLMAFGPRTCDH